MDIESVLVNVVGMDSAVTQSLIDGAAERCQGKHVLLVDDSRSAMALMKQTMESLGIIYSEFDSAVKALAHIEKNVRDGKIPELDLIISDIEMPGMDGFTFTRSIRAISELAHVPIALHSSMSNPANRHKAEESGANEFLPKFNPDALSQLVARLAF